MKGIKKLYTEYAGGKMIILGGIGLSIFAIANVADTAQIVLGTIFTGGAIVFQLERLREEVRELHG